MNCVKQIVLSHVRLMSLCVVVAAAALIAVISASGQVSAHLDPADPSRHSLAQAGQELVCLPNGSCTHGPDPAPEGVDPSAPQSMAIISSAEDTKVICDGNGTSGKRVQVLYIYRNGSPDNFNAYAESFKAWTVNTDQIYRNSAAKTGGSRYIRFVHDQNCVVSVIKVRVNTTLDYDSYFELNTELASRGYNRSDRIYLSYVDYESGGVCGWGNFRDDDSPGAANMSNTGSYSNYATIAVVYRGCWDSAMVGAHELGHNFGAVQPGAPRGTAGSHCTDEYDVMCYIDGAGVVMSYRCGAEDSWDDYEKYNNLLDCRNDDYFHTNPSSTSYLKTHWNVANNQFLGKSLVQMVFDKTSSKYNGVVTVSLSGFKPAYYINIKWPDGTVIAQVKAKEDGTAITTFRIPVVPLGDYLISASNSQGERTSRPIRVIPRTNLNRFSGESGDQVRVYLYGFAYKDKVEIRFYSTAGTSYQLLGTISIAANGRGTTVFSIPTDTTVGKHKIVGTVVGARRSASVTFTVTGLGEAEEPSPTAEPTETGTPDATPTSEVIPTETPTIGAPTPEPTTEIPTEEPTIEVPTELPTEEPTIETPTETPVPTEIPQPTNTPEAVEIGSYRRIW